MHGTQHPESHLAIHPFDLLLQQQQQQPSAAAGRLTTPLRGTNQLNGVGHAGRVEATRGWATGFIRSRSLSDSRPYTAREDDTEDCLM